MEVVLFYRELLQCRETELCSPHYSRALFHSLWAARGAVLPGGVFSTTNKPGKSAQIHGACGTAVPGLRTGPAGSSQNSWFTHWGWGQWQPGMWQGKPLNKGRASFIFIYRYRKKRVDWLLIKLYDPKLLYDLFSSSMLCYVYNYSINLYSLNYWLWKLSCAQGEIAELSSVYICKLLCNLIRGLGIFKLHCSTSAFIAVQPKVLAFQCS